MDSRGRRADASVLWALSDPNGRASVLRSRYVPGDCPLDPFFLHQPDTVIHSLGQLVSASRAWMDVGWKLTWKLVRRRGEPFVDDINGFTFMMDGNWRTRAWAARCGLAIWLLQQSYVLPIRAEDADPGAAAKRFLDRLSKEVHDRRIKIGVIDILTCPADNTVLTSVEGTGGVVVSLAVHGVSRHDAANVVELFRRLGRICAEEGGCIHLVKHVHAEPEVLRHMYRAPLAAFLEHKHALDPQGVLRNAFLERLASACAD